MGFLNLIMGLISATCIIAQTLSPHDPNLNLNYRNISDVKFVCPNVMLTESEGTISSPFFPNKYPRHLSCSWHIVGRIGEPISVKLEALDIEESPCPAGHKGQQPCCTTNWLKIGPTFNGTNKIFCGKDMGEQRTFLSKSNKMLIKFQISEYDVGGVGFQISYKLGYSKNGNCKKDEFMCANKKCIPSVLRCSGYPECDDGSDEKHCSNKCNSGRSCRTIFQCYDSAKHCDGNVDCPDFSDEMDCTMCPRSLAWCGGNSTQCYDPDLQRCDRVWNCLNGADEKDCYSVCPGLFMCESYGGCYTYEERCNGKTQCKDKSDEKHCVPEMCDEDVGAFLCDNGHCISDELLCNSKNDCIDWSDERNCLQNAILTAGLIGSLLCALLLTIAVRCAYRLMASRAPPIYQHRETPLSRMVDQEFFYREPPPPYSVAVQGDAIPRRSRPRRSRSSRGITRLPPRSRPPPTIPDTEILNDMTAIVASTEMQLQPQPQRDEIKADDTVIIRVRSPKHYVDRSRDIDTLHCQFVVPGEGGRCSRPVNSRCEILNSDTAEVSGDNDNGSGLQNDICISDSNFVSSIYVGDLNNPGLTREQNAINSTIGESYVSVIAVNGPIEESTNNHFCCDSDTQPLV